MDISVVVPLYNEAESLPELAAWIERVMAENNFSYEVLFINDGSTDNSWEVIKQLSAKNPAMKGVCLRRNYGKSPALNTGFERVQGDVVIKVTAGWSIVETLNAQSKVTHVRDNAVTVPAFILAPQVKSQRITDAIDASFLAPTVSRILRIRSPNAARYMPLSLY